MSEKTALRKRKRDEAKKIQTGRKLLQRATANLPPRIGATPPKSYSSGPAAVESPSVELIHKKKKKKHQNEEKSVNPPHLVSDYVSTSFVKPAEDDIPKKKKSTSHRRQDSVSTATTAQMINEESDKFIDDPSVESYSTKDFCSIVSVFVIKFK